MDEYGENSGVAADGAPQNNTEAGYMASLDRDGDPVAGVAEGKLALRDQVAQPGGSMWPNTRPGAVAPRVYAAGQKAIEDKVTEQLREERRLRTEALENDPRNRAEPDPPGQTGYQSDFGEPMSRDKLWEAVHSTVGGSAAGITARTAGAGPIGAGAVGLVGSAAGKTASHHPETLTAVVDDSPLSEDDNMYRREDTVENQRVTDRTDGENTYGEGLSSAVWGATTGVAATAMGAGIIGGGLLCGLGGLAGKIAYNHPEAVAAVSYDDLP